MPSPLNDGTVGAHSREMTKGKCIGLVIKLPNFTELIFIDSYN